MEKTINQLKLFSTDKKNTQVQKNIVFHSVLYSCIFIIKKILK